MAREWEDEEEIIGAAPEDATDSGDLLGPETDGQLGDGGEARLGPIILGINYIGGTVFSPCECVPLIAKVSYIGGDGSGIPVDFYICHRKCETRTVDGGIAALCIGKLGCGRYEVMARVDGRVTTRTIKVKQRCHRRRKDGSSGGGASLGGGVQ